MVGAVIVDNEGVVVGRGWHAFAGGPHAEIEALANAGARAKGATLYCTLEPCSHTGRTGPCAPRVAEAGIRRAVVAMRDPNPLVSGRGFAHLRGHGVVVTAGVLEAEARRLNAVFLTRISRHRPHVTLKVALSADGRVALGRGRPVRLTGPVSDRRVHRDRAAVDAIAVGSGTVLADDPLLTPRGAFRPRPLTRVIFDRRLRTPSSARVLSTLETGPVIILSEAQVIADRPGAAAALAAAGATIETLPNEGSAGFLMGSLLRLAELGVSSLVVEGGPALHTAFWDGRLSDRVQIYSSPVVVGVEGVSWFASLADVLSGLGNVTELVLPRAQNDGSDLLIEGDVHGTD
jgi:diaminohydroxyphosphoribosylaminopyrimidine deaminase/5-amino-6-(5-phosphoribosylamino)uracil reductase